MTESLEEINNVVNENEKKVYILEKTKKHLEVEIGDLHSSIAEYDTNFSREQAKYHRAQQDLLDIKHSVERKINEKEEEFENTRLIFY